MGANWTKFFSDLDWGLAVTLTVTFIVVLRFGSIILKYLRTKVEGQRTLLDHAHEFFFRSLLALAIINYGIRMLKIFLKNHLHNMVTNLLDLVHLSSRMTLSASTFVAIVIQCLMALIPDTMFNLTRTDENLATSFKIISIASMTLFSLIMKLLGVKGPAFSILEDEEEHDAPIVALHIPFVISMMAGIITRILLKVKYGKYDQEQRSRQIVPNRVFLACIPIIGTGILLNKFGHPQILRYVRVLYPNVGTAGFLFLLIFMHRHGMRGYAWRAMARDVTKAKEMFMKVRCTFRRGKVAPMAKISRDQPTRSGETSSNAFGQNQDSGILRYYP